ALSLMQLAEAGKVDIDADVREYLPEFQPHNPFANNPSGPHGSHVSLRKLMSHTAGMVREPKSGHYLDAQRPPLSETVSELAASTLKEDPSAGVFRYSNAGIAVVGRVVELISGCDFNTYVADNLFRPIGMSKSANTVSPELLARLAPAWMWTIDADILAPVFDLGGSPAGNIFSTLSDMGLFARTLLRGGFTANGSAIVSPGTLARMWLPAGERPPGYGGDLKGYGLGFGLGDVDGWASVGHGGAVYGFATQMTLLPAAGLGALIFSTLDFSNQIASRLTVKGLQLALAERRMGATPVPPTPRTPLKPDDLERLSGHYVDREEGEDVEIRASNGRLYLMGDGVPLELRRISGTDFRVDGRIYGEGADYAHMEVAFPARDEMRWKEKEWQKTTPSRNAVPSEIAPHLGEYGPDFNVTTLFYSNGALQCLIEYFCTHQCEPVSRDRFKMHGLLYESEVLELGAVDDEGRRGIRVGQMFLERRS
ncbi:serine hydrolase, partial [uncultured Nitratireductor sp.]|uniref:serine hydrolase domain-containing protein n=1 Tax=uncultured Nitratireductor sp. TaxID=520953 RepID=UPI0025DE651B